MLHNVQAPFEEVSMVQVVDIFAFENVKIFRKIDAKKKVSQTSNSILSLEKKAVEFSKFFVTKKFPQPLATK